MSDRSGREPEYVIIRNQKGKKASQYYQDDDGYDDDEIPITTTRRVVRSKPQVEQRIKYVTAEEVEPSYRRQRVAESSDARLQVRKTTRGENVILDDDDNIIKVVRNMRTPTPPPVVEGRHVRYRTREPQTLYYETSDGRLVTRPQGRSKKNVVSTKTQVIYPDDEPTRVIRRVIIDPRTGDRETVYEKDKPKKQEKVVIRQTAAELPIDSDYEEEQPQYVRVAQRRNDVSPRRRESQAKYVVIKNPNDRRSRPAYTFASSSTDVLNNNRRVVYEAPKKKSSTTYVYSDRDKYYR